jgi:hypothetical protein
MQNGNLSFQFEVFICLPNRKLLVGGSIGKLLGYWGARNFQLHRVCYLNPQIVNDDEDAGLQTEIVGDNDIHYFENVGHIWYISLNCALLLLQWN